MTLLGAKVRVPEATCPACQKAVDGASNTAGVKTMPKEGDLSICIFCANVAQYDAALQLTPFDITQLPLDEQKEIERYRVLIRRANAKG